MVARNADFAELTQSTTRPASGVADRWIFVFMAALFVVTALTGFIPSSIEKIAAIQAGARPPFPPVLHVHAVLMGTWLLLLLTQAGLVATDRRSIHQKLGIASLVVAPAMVVTGFILVPTGFRTIWGLAAAPPPGMDTAVIAETQSFITNVSLMQIRAGILFPLFVAWALLLRKSDPETHKRLTILATVIPLPAAIDRIGWLPTTMPTNSASPDLYILLWILPMFVYDLIKHRRVPRAYIIWLVVSLPLTIAVHALWGSQWWMTAAPKIMGVG